MAQTTWQPDDAITLSTNPNETFVLWQDYGHSWQLMKVYDLAGDLKTVNYVGDLPVSELETATKVGTWSDTERRVILESFAGASVPASPNPTA